MSRNIDFTTDNPKELSIFNWKIESYCPSYNSSTLTNKFPSTVPYTGSTTVPYTGSTTEPIFRITDNSEQRLYHGTEVVENKFTFDERETHSYCTTTNDNQLGCSQNRGLGVCITGDFNRGTWTQAKSQLHINTLELIAAELAIKTFTKGKEVTFK